MRKILLILAPLFLSLSTIAQDSLSAEESRNDIHQAINTLQMGKLGMSGFRIDSVIGISNVMIVGDTNYAIAKVLAHRALNKIVMMRIYEADLKAEGINSDSVFFQQDFLWGKKNFYAEWQTKYAEKFGAENVIVDKELESAVILSNDVVSIYCRLFIEREVEEWMCIVKLPPSLFVWRQVDSLNEILINELFAPEVKIKLDNIDEFFSSSAN